MKPAVARKGPHRFDDFCALVADELQHLVGGSLFHADSLQPSLDLGGAPYTTEAAPHANNHTSTAAAELQRKDALRTPFLCPPASARAGGSARRV